MELQLGQSKGGYRNVIRQQIECLRKISNGSNPKYWKYTIFHMIKLKVFPIYSSSITSASAKECLMCGLNIRYAQTHTSFSWKMVLELQKWLFYSQKSYLKKGSILKGYLLLATSSSSFYPVNNT